MAEIAGLVRELGSAVAEAEALLLRALGLSSSSEDELRQVWSDATESPSSPAPSSAEPPETAEPDGDRIVYTSGDADTTETIGELTGNDDV